MNGSTERRSVSRPWVPTAVDDLVGQIASGAAALPLAEAARHIEDLTASNRRIHERECINLNPATNAMNPKAEALLASGLGSRPSLGYPGEKYEMGLEAIEQIEVIATELACQVFDASFAEVRVGSGALANLYTFMATTRPGDSVIVPPPSIGGHVTHNAEGAAGLHGLVVHEAPIDAERYTIDVDGLASLAREVKPSLISVGGSLNLFPHPVAGIREVADEVGARVLFDAAHLSGPIAGGAWPNPLGEGAHLITMSTYKSLAGPPSGLIVTNDASLAERLDAIAYPGLTANFDVAKTAALAVTLVDWLAHGREHARAMILAAAALASELGELGSPVVALGQGSTTSHAFALDATRWGGGHAAATRLRRANLLTCAIGLPHDLEAGLRIGTNELVRWGAGVDHMNEVAELVHRALVGPPEHVADDATKWRRRFTEVGFVQV